MNAFNTMPAGVAEMGMVWMGAGQSSPDIPLRLVGTENNDIMLDNDNVYYTPPHNSMSNQSIEDIGPHNSNMNMMENFDMQYIELKTESGESYAEDDKPQPVYMITTATQTLPCPKRKIKPIKHPGLVLKTPIAYQGNTDPSVIPIQKDGIAICQKCGAIGVKHAFYTRERRFCSMACARGYNGLIPEPLPQSNPNTPETNEQYAKHRFVMKTEDDYGDNILAETVPLIVPQREIVSDDEVPLVRRNPPELANSYDWDMQLMDEDFSTAPVTCFKHAPMVDIWDNIMVGMKVEVENTDCDNVSEAFPDSFWVATVLKIIGYKALLRYEGFGLNKSKDFWVSLCSNQVHPVGWCATRGKPLIPPKTIEGNYTDWKEFLRKRLTGARTLPSNYSNKIQDSLKSRFECGMNVEVVDKMKISQVKVATISKIVGKRLNVKYHDLPTEEVGFWCHEDSQLLHPVGWARKVNHHLMAPLNYMEKLIQGIYDDVDATEDLFTPLQVGSEEYNLGISVGMKLEAVDPLNLSAICSATVKKVLNCGFIMIRIDRYNVDVTGADWFCYHIKSPCIFPVGFCKSRDIPLVPPKGYNSLTFNWYTYLTETNKQAVPEMLFNTYIPQHGFEVGMKIEAADLMDPRLVCVATITKIAGRMLKVHFDGWDAEFDQWLDCESPDIYPVGWCESVGHKLEGPPQPTKTGNVPRNPRVKKKSKKKRQKVAHSCYEHPIKTEIKSDDFVVNNYTEDESLNTDSGMEYLEALPEAAQVPFGTDASLPVSTEGAGDSPPQERKVTSYVNASNNASAKVIPRLVDNSGSNEGAGDLCPDTWNVFDVAQFLRVNDCANYCDSFSKQKVDGKMLLELNKEDILEFTGGKVGPSLKIYDLVQQLKIKINPSQLRHMKANIKKFL